MTRLTPCKRNDFVRRLRKLGFDGPFTATRHQFMLYETHIPSNSEFSVAQVKFMLAEVESIIGRKIKLLKRAQFLNENTDQRRCFS